MGIDTIEGASFDLPHLELRTFLCMKCFSKKVSNHKKCMMANRSSCKKCKTPCPKCCRSTMVQIDEEMVELIEFLNTKKIITLSCCFGLGRNHLFHIVLKKQYILPKLPYPFIQKGDKIEIISTYETPLTKNILDDFLTHLRKNIR